MKNRITTVLKIVSLSFLFSTHLKANRICRNTFAIDPRNLRLASINEYSSDITQSFIAYLSTLLEQQSITQENLLRFIEGLKEDRLINPIQYEYAETKSTAFIQQEGIDDYLSSPELDRSRLLEWAVDRIEEERNFTKTRKRIHEATQDLFQEMKFNPIPTGKFHIGIGKKIKIVLTHRTEAMSTPVTQLQWVTLMGENPSYFKIANEIYKTTIFANDKSILLLPNHPVENITWWSAIVFANKLSEKHGFMPAYDIRDIIWQSGTSAEDGTLKKLGGECKINAPNGDYYRSQGFRLPTEYEQEFLLQSAFSTQKNFYNTELTNHAWFHNNSHGTTHAVAQLSPITFNGAQFYDLFGNVSEWGWYEQSPSRLKENNTDPTFFESYNLCSFRGGGWDSSHEECHYSTRDHAPPCWRNNGLGLRLWRTIE